MTPWLWRVVGATAMFATGLLVVPVACSVTPRDEAVGKLFQECFPGNTCDPGLTCVAMPVPTDGSSLGTDGGRCVCLRGACESDAGPADLDAAGP